jgi:hypothetical protein
MVTMALCDYSRSVPKALHYALCFLIFFSAGGILNYSQYITTYHNLYYMYINYIFFTLFILSYMFRINFL